MTIEYRVRPVTRYIITRYESTENVGSVGTVGELPSVAAANRICEALAVTEGGAVAYLAPIHDSHCAVHNMPAYPEGQCDCSARCESELLADADPSGKLASRIFSSQRFFVNSSL